MVTGLASIKSPWTQARIEGCREALELAAKAAEGDSKFFDFGAARAHYRDSEAGYHTGRMAAADDIRALLSEFKAKG